MLRAITGLLGNVAHVHGRMTVAGEHQGHKRSRRFRRSVQMVFQDPYGALHPRHTVDQIMSEPANIHGMSDVESRVLRAWRRWVWTHLSVFATRIRFPVVSVNGWRWRVR